MRQVLAAAVLSIAWLAGIAGAADSLPSDPRRADVLAVLPAVRDLIRAWSPDGVLVDLRCEPHVDGTVDLTEPGGNLMCFGFSPSKNAGATITFDAAGRPTLTPSPTPTSPCRYAIPSNIIGLGDAITVAMRGGLDGRLSRVELNGSGDDPNLRQFCWTILNETRPWCVDAMFGFNADFKEFNDGRVRSRRIPITADDGANRLTMRIVGDDVQIFWCRMHAVYLDGKDEAVVVLIPWQLMAPDEMAKHSHPGEHGPVYETGVEVYPPGPYTPLTADGRRRMRANDDAVEIDTSPGVVLVEGYAKLTEAQRTGVRAILNAAPRQ